MCVSSSMTVPECPFVYRPSMQHRNAYASHRTDFAGGVVWWQDYNVSKRRGSYSHFAPGHTHTAIAPQSIQLHI